MSLSKRQQIFAFNLSKQVIYINEQEGYSCTFGEAYRPPETAKAYADKGIGINDSLHILKLAVDLNLFYKGAYLRKTEDHKKFGEYWKSLHPDNEWGGDYDDGNHYAMKRR